MDSKNNHKKVSAGFTGGMIMLLLVLVGIYGPLSRDYNESTQMPPTGLRVGPDAGIPLVVLHLLFTLVGFGLLLTAGSESKWSGMSIALYVVAFNFMFAPFIQKFWFEVFFGFRSSSTDTSMVAEFWSRASTTSRVTPSYESIRLSNLVSVSYLVALTAFIGRARIQTVAITLILYNVAFYLNFYLNALLCYSTTNKSEPFVYFDDYGTIFVYLFGGVAGIIAGVITKSPKKAILREHLLHSRNSFFFSAIGSLFIFASFLCSFTGVINGLNEFRFNSGAIMMAFGIVAGIIGSFVGSIFAGNGYLHHRVFSIGLISGGIMTGILAGEYNNIGIASFLGFVGGLVAGIFNTAVRPRMNKNNMIDTQGLLGSIVVVCLFAAYVIAPSMLNQLYIRRDSVSVITKNAPETDWRVARYHLIYPSLTIALAAVAGIITGAFNKLGNDQSTDYRDTKFFAEGFGLCDEPPKGEQVEYKPSMTQHQLNRETGM